MASTDTLLSFQPLANHPPSSNYATIDMRGDVRLLDVDDSPNAAGQFLPHGPRHYNSGLPPPAET